MIQTHKAADDLNHLENTFWNMEPTFFHIQNLRNHQFS